MENKVINMKQIHIEEWQKLFDLIPQIVNTKKFSIMKGCEKQTDGTFQFPYSVSSKVVDEFQKLANGMGIICDFDWVTWHEGRKILSDQNFDSLDAEPICKLITTIVRSNRFNEGYLISKFENGTITKILLRLKATSSLKQ